VDELKLLAGIEKLIKRSLPKEIVPGFEVDPRIKAEPILNGRNGPGGGGRGQQRQGGQRSGQGASGQRSDGQRQQQGQRRDVAVRVSTDGGNRRPGGNSQNRRSRTVS
jgi:ATP-dependent RNA helicase RhlE